MTLTESPSLNPSCEGRREAAGCDAHRNVVWLRGEYDISTVTALAETLARAMALDDTDLVIDLGEVRFMDAATIGVIIRARDHLGRQSRSLTLRSSSEFAQRVLALCGLTDLLDPPPAATRTRSARHQVGAA